MLPIGKTPDPIFCWLPRNPCTKGDDHVPGMYPGCSVTAAEAQKCVDTPRGEDKSVASGDRFGTNWFLLASTPLAGVRQDPNYETLTDTNDEASSETLLVLSKNVSRSLGDSNERVPTNTGCSLLPHVG